MKANLKKPKKILKLASYCGLDAVKFQIYNPNKYESKNNLDRFKRLKHFNLSDKNYLNLFKEAKKSNLNVLATPLTEDKVKLAGRFGRSNQGCKWRSQFLSNNR